ncbi:hypothetical protein DFH08DRAFT_806919 [Mycena albidolilacea]|uniref:Uncharacterized protein n=1 Tax=Mycena albidolilacea TaxID=1033008 RepID=A0AAD7EUK8_9AGAR|nr:hypothetical protein DFH08DRAFT_806919 [Mycena albidolilacea]
MNADAAAGCFFFGKLSASTRGKRWSPVKGLFPFSLSSASSASATQTPCPIQVPLPPLVSVDGDAPEEEDEDAWVDKDKDSEEGEDEGEDQDGEMTVVEDQECGGDKGLPTPVPWHSDLLAPHTPPALSVDVHVGAPPVYYESEREGEELQTPVSGRYSREATPTPYTRGEEEWKKEGQQVGRKWKQWPPHFGSRVLPAMSQTAGPRKLHQKVVQKFSRFRPQKHNFRELKNAISDKGSDM